jgi:hypothetical protein
MVNAIVNLKASIRESILQTFTRFQETGIVLIIWGSMSAMEIYPRIEKPSYGTHEVQGGSIGRDGSLCELSNREADN